MDAAFSATFSQPGAGGIPRLCLLLGRAEREVRRGLAAGLESQELTADEFFLLAACDVTPRPGQTELAAAMGVSPAQASTLLERLRQRDLLTPQRSDTDRRRQAWALTPLGHERLEAAWLALAPILADLSSRVPQTAWELLSAALNELANAAPQRRHCA